MKLKKLLKGLDSHTGVFLADYEHPVTTVTAFSSKKDIKKGVLGLKVLFWGFSTDERGNVHVHVILKGFVISDKIKRKNNFKFLIKENAVLRHKYNTAISKITELNEKLNDTQTQLNQYQLEESCRAMSSDDTETSLPKYSCQNEQSSQDTVEEKYVVNTNRDRDLKEEIKGLIERNPYVSGKDAAHELHIPISTYYKYRKEVVDQFFNNK